MQTTGTHFNYYFVCKRKLWLFANGIGMEHTSDTVYEGKLIHESTYPQRSERYEEIEVGGCKIDFYDPRNKLIHEIKKSDKIEEAHKWQLKYYIRALELIGVQGASGVVEYPTLRKTEKVSLTDEDRDRMSKIENDISEICSLDSCPDRIKSGICKKCSYYEFCYVGED